MRSLEKYNVTYSVDMLRVKTFMTYIEFYDLEFRFNTVWKSYVDKVYISNKKQDFKYNYKIKIEEGIGFWFGFFHNSEEQTSNEYRKYNFTIEFNPNKCGKFKILNYLLSNFDKYYLRSVDLACDIPISILDLMGLDRGNKRKISILSYGMDDKTIYIGEGDGRVKIYNKKKESKLNILGHLTRIEISKQYEDFDIEQILIFRFLEEYFPNIYTNPYYFSFEDYDDKTLFVHLYALQSGLDMHYFTRRYKEKVKKCLEGGNKIKFDSLTAEAVIRLTLIDYFSDNKYMHFS